MIKFIDIILGLTLAGIIIVFIVFGFTESNQYIYECTDYKGDVVYCTQAYTLKGGMFGYLKDGTKISITSYKRILKKELGWEE